MTADDPIENDLRAGVSIQLEPANQLLEIRVVTLGNADHIDIVGDPATHFDPAELQAEDFQELEIEVDDLEPAGHDGRVTAIAWPPIESRSSPPTTPTSRNEDGSDYPDSSVGYSSSGSVTAPGAT